SASILTADFGKIGEEIARMEKSGVDMIHCDVMDGIFVPNITFGFKMVADIRKRTSLPLDVHLMIDRPERYVERFVECGADFVTVHYEATNALIPTLEAIKKAGAKCGAVVSPDTPTAVLTECFPLCDMVLLMSVHPGYGGQKFVENSVPRMRELVELRRKTSSKALLEVDGGINADTAKRIVEAGADVLVMGNALFASPEPEKIIQGIRTL
ncbi:MAG: ribulose-phosphate 3-epimerase, partial [Clostridiales bacterium]|nr:ribulose-phosphate 3-epimerase [Clostridiales bacterium]